MYDYNQKKIKTLKKIIFQVFLKILKKELKKTFSNLLSRKPYIPDINWKTFFNIFFSDLIETQVEIEEFLLYKKSNNHFITTNINGGIDVYLGEEFRNSSQLFINQSIKNNRNTPIKLIDLKLKK